jgi:hypothetical protein
LPPAVGQELLDLELAAQVARAVPRLPEIKVLLGAYETALEAQPAARSVSRRERRRLLERRLPRVHAKVAQRAGGVLGQQDVDELARAGTRVEHAGVAHHLLPAGRVPLGAHDEDVVEQRAAANGARVRLVRHSRLVEPVIPVRAHDLRVMVIDLVEELAGTR